MLCADILRQAIEKAKLNQLEEKKLQLLMSEIREAEAAVAGRDTAVDTMRTSGDDTAVGTMRTSGDDTTGTSVGGLNLGSASPSTSNSTDSSGGNAGQDATQGSTLTSDEPSTIGNSGETTSILTQTPAVNVKEWLGVVSM